MIVTPYQFWYLHLHGDEKHLMVQQFNVSIEVTRETDDCGSLAYQLTAGLTSTYFSVDRDDV